MGRQASIVFGCFALPAPTTDRVERAVARVGRRSRRAGCRPRRWPASPWPRWCRERGSGCRHRHGRRQLLPSRCLTVIVFAVLAVTSPADAAQGDLDDRGREGVARAGLALGVDLRADLHVGLRRIVAALPVDGRAVDRQRGRAAAAPFDRDRVAADRGDLAAGPRGRDGSARRRRTSRRHCASVEVGPRYRPRGRRPCPPGLAEEDLRVAGDVDRAGPAVGGLETDLRAVDAGDR